MDEAAAAISEDGAEGRPHEDDTHQNYIKDKETDGSEYLDICATI